MIRSTHNGTEQRNSTQCYQTIKTPEGILYLPWYLLLLLQQFCSLQLWSTITFFHYGMLRVICQCKHGIFLFLLLLFFNLLFRLKAEFLCGVKVFQLKRQENRMKHTYSTWRLWSSNSRKHATLLSVPGLPCLMETQEYFTLKKKMVGRETQSSKCALTKARWFQKQEYCIFFYL